MEEKTESVDLTEDELSFILCTLVARKVTTEWERQLVSKINVALTMLELESN